MRAGLESLKDTRCALVTKIVERQIELCECECRVVEELDEWLKVRILQPDCGELDQPGWEHVLRSAAAAARITVAVTTSSQ